MDVEWCRERLQRYLDAVEAYDKPDALEKGPEWQEMHRRFPTAQAILQSLDPDNANLHMRYPSLAAEHLKVLHWGVGILRDRAELRRALIPDAPTLLADRMHPWVWEAARPLWEIQQFRQALLAAWTAINAQLQAKIGRRDVSDDKLIQECFSDKDPEPGKPRLRVPGDPTDQTVQSRQRGTRDLALGCVWAIRNPAAHLAAHDAGELNEQEALEQLATLSTLARLLDECEVLTAT